MAMRKCWFSWGFGISEDALYVLSCVFWVLAGLAGWLAAWLAKPAGWLAGWLLGWLAGWAAGWPGGCLRAWLAGWVAGGDRRECSMCMCFCVGFIRLVEMLLVCLWSCLQRMYYLHMFLEDGLSAKLKCYFCVCGAVCRECNWIVACVSVGLSAENVLFAGAFRGVYMLNWNAACVSLGLSAENVLFAYVFRVLYA